MIGYYKNYEIAKTSEGEYVARDKGGRVKFRGATEEELIKNIDLVVRGPDKPPEMPKKTIAPAPIPNEPAEGQTISRQATVTSSTVKKAPITEAVRRGSSGKIASKPDTQSEKQSNKKSFWDRLKT